MGCGNDDQAEHHKAAYVALGRTVRPALLGYDPLAFPVACSPVEHFDPEGRIVGRLDLSALGNIKAAIQLVLGYDIITGEQVSRWWQLAALVPVAGQLGRAERAAARVEGRVGREATERRYVDILSPQSRQHILYGDGRGGGGHYPPGQAGKTLFPANWSPDQVIHNVGDIATAPDTRWFAQSGNGGAYTGKGKPARWVAWEVRDGIQVRVIYEPATGKVISAFPDSAGPPPNLRAIAK